MADLRPVTQFLNQLAAAGQQQPMPRAGTEAIGKIVAELPKGLRLTQEAIDRVAEKAGLPAHYKAYLSFALALHRVRDLIAKDAEEAEKKHLPIDGKRLVEQLNDSFQSGVKYLLEVAQADEGGKVARALSTLVTQLADRPPLLSQEGASIVHANGHAAVGVDAEKRVIIRGMPTDYDAGRVAVTAGFFEAGQENPLGIRLLDADGKPGAFVELRSMSTAALAALVDLLRGFLGQLPAAANQLAAGNDLAGNAGMALHEVSLALSEKHQARLETLQKAEDKLRDAMAGFQVAKIEREAMEGLLSKLGLG